MQIRILDLGLNNLTSVVKCFEANSREEDSVEVVTQQENHLMPSLMVLPGLGKFGVAMDSMKDKNFHSMLLQNLSVGGKVLGICLGMQLLSTTSEESPEAKGLDLIPGKIRKLNFAPGERVPNIGWNTVFSKRADHGFLSLRAGLDFYFVHSFVFEPSREEDILATTKYGDGEFTSAVFNEQVLGFQFHPEKSSIAGAQLIRESMNWARSEV
jgi:glutamine amidotransferase